MNREIKFRAWEYRHERTSGEGWQDSPFKWQMNYSPELEGGETFGYGSTVNLNKALKNGGYDDEEYKNEHPSIFMQYTGLKDKNGKEVYAGDILGNFKIHKNRMGYNLPEHIEIYWFDEEYAYWGRETKKTKENYDYDLCWTNWYDFEVVGNIYENSNLLKKKKNE